MVKSSTTCQLIKQPAIVNLDYFLALINNQAQIIQIGPSTCTSLHRQKCNAISFDNIITAESLGLKMAEIAKAPTPGAWGQCQTTGFPQHSELSLHQNFSLQPHEFIQFNVGRIQDLYASADRQKQTLNRLGIAGHAQ